MCKNRIKSKAYKKCYVRKKTYEIQNCSSLHFEVCVERRLLVDWNLWTNIWWTKRFCANTCWFNRKTVDRKLVERKIWRKLVERKIVEASNWWKLVERKIDENLLSENCRSEQLTKTCLAKKSWSKAWLPMVESWDFELSKVV